MRASLHTDGGARGNPGPAGIGAVLKSRDGNVVAELARSLDETTNNVAEYEALIAGLQLALDHGVTELEVCLDSELVVSQMKGEWKIRNDRLRSLAARAQALMSRLPSVTIRHVPRSENADADRLANEAMDAAAEGAELEISSLQQQELFPEGDRDPQA